MVNLPNRIRLPQGKRSFVRKESANVVGDHFNAVPLQFHDVLDLQPEATRTRRAIEEAEVRCNCLDDEMIDRICANLGHLLDVLRLRYGHARWFAEADISNWSRALATLHS